MKNTRGYEKFLEMVKGGVQMDIPKSVSWNVSRASVLLFSFFAFLQSASAAFIGHDPERVRYEEEIEARLKSKVQFDLTRYCPDGCALLGIDVDSREVFESNNASLGFETAAPQLRRFMVRKASAEILVDNRLGSANIDKLQDVLVRASKRYGMPVELEITRTTLPDSPSVVRAEAEAKKEAMELVRPSLEKLIADFCPNECRLNGVEVRTVRTPLDETQLLPAKRVVVIRDSKWALAIRGASVDLAVDDKMDDDRRAQLEELFHESMETFGAPVLNVKRTIFPRTAREMEKDADDNRADPWGLEKLGRALKVFEKEKEKEKEQNSEKTKSSVESVNKSRESSQIQSQSEKQKTSTSSTESSSTFWTQEKILLFSGMFVLLLIIATLGLRYVLTGKQVQHLISEGRGAIPPSTGLGFESGFSDEDSFSLGDEGALSDVQTARHPAQLAPKSQIRTSESAGFGLSEQVAVRMNLQTLRDELIQSFIVQPKIAREVFARVLREDGVEFSAKCVAILGEIVVFDLSADDDLKKEVALLAEYIHVSQPIVSDSEQLNILRALKLKMTAGKVRQMTTRSRETFDFLKSLSGRQIYDLIIDESSRSQAVVLTQLQTEKRRSVFELFEGNVKGDLMRQLCVKDSLSREYLQNVADALKRKLQKSHVVDGEMLGGADVLIDLIERSDKTAQEQMMKDLDQTNSDLALQVRSRLVSVETLAYLSDGLLLEIFLALEPKVMLVFLAGTRDNVRQLITSKAPEDIAKDWMASAANFRGIDAENFRLAEMQVLGKIRAFASSGLINISEINAVMFPRSASGKAPIGTSETAKRFKVSSPFVA
ncbi:hypothetical protein EBU99_11400 [bacterium]|nr:hypothetical protein [bacterium]